jgi:hypothetical protein
VSAKKTATLVLVPALLLLGAELVARVVAPRPKGFAIRPEVHPLLGEAPAGAFTKAPDEPVLKDHLGRAFPRKKAEGASRLLVLGARRAASAALAEALAKKGEVVVGAWPGYAPLQGFFVYSAFGRTIRADAVLYVDAEEVLAQAPPYPGWTPAWTRHHRTLAHPLIAALSEQSRLFAVLVGEPILGPDTEPSRAAGPDDLSRFASDTRSLAALCEADKVPFAWITLGEKESGYEPPASRARVARLAAAASDDEIAKKADELLGR